MVGETGWKQASPRVGATWTERGCSELEGTPTDQLQLVVSYLRAMEVRCVECQVRYAGTCRQCHLRWCTLCQQDKEECDVCGVPLALTVDLGAGRAKSSTQRLRAKGVRDAEVTSVNMALPVQRRGLCAMLAFIFAACTNARL